MKFLWRYFFGNVTKAKVPLKLSLWICWEAPLLSDYLVFSTDDLSRLKKRIKILQDVRKLIHSIDIKENSELENLVRQLQKDIANLGKEKLLKKNNVHGFID